MSEARPLDLEAASLATCLAHVLGTPAADVPVGGEDPLLAVREWLAGHGLGLVPVADPPRFGWAGPWIARVAAPGGGRASVVAFGTPPGVLLDPAGAADAGADAFLEGWVVARHRAPTLPELGRADPGPAGTVERILLAREAGAPMRETDRAEAVAGRGLLGDRYADGAGTFSDPASTGHDLTFVEAEVLEELGIDAAAARRNVVTRGVALDALIGRTFTVGDAECVGRRRCEPCAHLQRLSGPGILRALAHRGGLRADVVRGGPIAAGAPIALTGRSSRSTPPRG
jgi:hypothetical protein